MPRRKVTAPLLRSVEATEHYRVTRDFLDGRERFFRELFKRD